MQLLCCVLTTPTLDSCLFIITSYMKHLFDFVWLMYHTAQMYFCFWRFFFSFFPSDFLFFPSTWLLFFLPTTVTCGVHQTIGALLPDKWQILMLGLNLLYIEIGWFVKSIHWSGFSSSWFQHVKILALHCHASTFRLWPLMIWVGVVSSVTPHPEWSPLCSPKHTRIQTTAMTHHSNSSVRDHMKWVSGCLHLQNHHHGFSVSWCQFISLLVPFLNPAPPPPPWVPVSVRSPTAPLSLSALTRCLCCQAGLLGCEAVLSSMALMQANSIPGQKKMMSSLGQGHRASPDSQSQHSHNHHGHQVHHGQPHHSHMGHPSGGSCPPLVREMPHTAPCPPQELLCFFCLETKTSKLCFQELN